MISKIKLRDNYFYTIYSILLIYFLFYDYKYFGFFTIFIIFFYYLENSPKNINSFFKIFFRISPYIFYGYKLFIGLFRKSDWTKTFFDVRVPFADLYGTLMQLNCQHNQIYLLQDGFKSMTQNCFWGDVRYGPLFHLLKVEFLDIYKIIFPILLYLAFLIFAELFRKELNFNEFEFNILILSPVVNQLLSQLNIDIFIFLVVYFCIRFFSKYKLLILVIFLLLALVKSHPVGLLIGFALFKHKNNFDRLMSVFAISLFAGINLYIFTLDNNFLAGQPRPSTFYSSSGLLTISQYIWINFLNYLYGYRTVIFILSLLVLTIFMTIFYKKNLLTEKIKFDISNINIYNFSICTWFVFSSLYANYDYRNIILVLILPILSSKKGLQYIILLLCLLSPIPVLDSILIRGIFFTVKIISYFVLVVIVSHILVSSRKSVLDVFAKKIGY